MINILLQIIQLYPNDTVVVAMESGNNASGRAGSLLSLIHIFGEEVTTLQSILDGIMPGLIGLGGTWMYFWLLKKKVNPIMLILGTMVLLSLIHI